MVTRRDLLALLPATAASLALAGCAGLATAPARTAPRVGGSLPSDEALLADLEQRTFRYFWQTANPVNGLSPDRWPGTAPMASVASVGFALTAYVAGVDRGFVSRTEARDRVLATVRFFADAPQGPQAAGMTGHHGFFYHFLHMQTGARFNANVELSTIDTALLLGGMLCAQAYFDGEDAAEAEIRRRVDQIYGRVDWPWAQRRPGFICMGWTPESGFERFIDYTGYDEAMLLLLLAMGSPTHPADDTTWTAFTRTYSRSWGGFLGYEHLGGSPLFFHQYSHVWVDFRGIQDDYMRRRGLDYFENSRRATLSQRAYATLNPGGWKDYDQNVWGLTACDGPGMLKLPDHSGRMRQFFDYRARGAGLQETVDDGTVAPTAALSSLPFAPEVVVPALRELRRRFGDTIYGRYGFLDAFNTSFTAANAPIGNGQVIPGFGWVDTDYLGIDQGPIVTMIANHRNGLIWQTMRKNPHLRRGLERAGFRGAWLAGA
ncbi:glucoamylase family protein [Aquabacterium sp.]|uniref:glucoamylase family protein n=1 Tax=Aquabacterium sp. TaxID=1872578 RepID=UPI002CDA6E0F|nr:glucoamylase family protein [Aquabacterium sp.]HSW09224.1 glucoamylase family protein [Aquabacterium sp.]